MKITMISHACTLIELGGKNILTDPWMTEPLYFGRLRHKYGTGLNIEDLPPLDLIIASHGHDDHLDPQTMARLDKNTPVAIWKDAAQKARAMGFTDVRPMDAGQSFRLDGLEALAFRGQHPGGLAAFLLRDKNESLLFAGDSGPGIDRAGIKKQGAGIDVCLLPISGAKIGFYQITMGPRQSAELARELNARTVIPIHYHFKFSPPAIAKVIVPGTVEEFERVARELCPGSRTVILDVGARFDSRAPTGD